MTRIFPVAVLCLALTAPPLLAQVPSFAEREAMYLRYLELATLIEDVPPLNLPQGIENSLLVKLAGALNKLEHGNNVAAINKLNAFVKEVEPQTGKEIPSDVADNLTDAAETIIALLSAS